MDQKLFLQPEEILEWIWTLSNGTYIFLPRQLREGGVAEWEEGIAYGGHNPATKLSVSRIMADVRQDDRYFSVLTFTNPERKTENVADEKYLTWLDLDFVPEGADPTEGLPDPNMLWSTSPGHYQAIWALSEPYEASKARLLTDRTPGADKGGWHTTKVLRIPGTENWKRGGVRGGVIRTEPTGTSTWEALLGDAANSVQEVGTISLEHPHIPSRGEWDKLLASLWNKLPLSVRYNLRNNPRRGPNVSRSEIIFDVAAMLSRAGVEDKDAFRLIWHAPWNKFLDRPMQLWRDVQKAYARAR